MNEIMNTVTNGFDWAKNLGISDVYSVITAILRFFGYEGPDYIGVQSMADVVDWLTALIGPLANLYAAIGDRPAMPFIEIVNKIFALFS